MFQRERLLRSLNALGIDPRVDIFDDLAAAYDADTRYYHTREHIESCLSLFDSYRNFAQNPAEVEIALWFHDAVYDTHRNDSEERSARWAAEYLTSEGIVPEVAKRIQAAILATTTHVASSGDIALLLDLDLSILGAPEPIFEAYDSAIRKEYAWVPRDRYRTERSRILQSFFDRDFIFKTHAIRASLETPARENLSRKLCDLNI